MPRMYGLSALVFAAALMPGLCRADALEADAQSAATKGRGVQTATTWMRWASSTRRRPRGDQGRDADPRRHPEVLLGLKAKGWDDHKTTVKTAVAKDKLLIVSGRWQMTVPGDGGAKKTFEGNWVNVLERQPDGWRTVLHTWN